MGNQPKIKQLIITDGNAVGTLNIASGNTRLSVYFNYLGLLEPDFLADVHGLRHGSFVDSAGARHIAFQTNLSSYSAGNLKTNALDNILGMELVNFRTAANRRAHIMFGEQVRPSLPANFANRSKDKFISFPDLFLECKFNRFAQPNMALTYSGREREGFWNYVTRLAREYGFEAARGGCAPGYSGCSVWDISSYAAAKLLFGLRQEFGDVRFARAELPLHWENLTFRIEKD